VLERMSAGCNHVDIMPACLERDAALRLGRLSIGADFAAVSLAVHVLCDLACQGWSLRQDGNTVAIAMPGKSADREEDRERVRRALSLARLEQLAKPSVRAFIKRMETRRPGPKGWTSVFSLMRDGRELADALEAVSSLAQSPARADALEQVTRPYIQFVVDGERCRWTGLALSDIWRYFRYTWLTPSRSVPGRNMMILVRDAAVEPHPVIGIAALSNSIVQQRERDAEIGWDRQGVLSEIATSPSDDLANWLMDALHERISEVQASDLMTDVEFMRPSNETIDNLVRLAVSEREKHQMHGEKLGYRQRQHDTDWETLAGLHLYRSKRALALADLLKIQLGFKASGFTEVTAKSLTTAADCPAFRDAVARLVRVVKATRVGINMMDISVAGAIAPYQAILGGKLVSLLLASPEVRNAYSRRYAALPSVIASAMHGSAVSRTPNLVLLCTTGLFAGGSSQYNRVKLPASVLGGREGVVRYQKLAAETEFATFHISEKTLAQMAVYAAQTDRGKTVNGIFGEGVNPKMRKIREGLNAVGFPPEHVLRAGSPRSVYMIPLAHNYKDVLLGRCCEPDYILPNCERDGDATAAIAAFWRKRWLNCRIASPTVMADVRSHTVAYPVIHGARVRLGTDVNYESNDVESGTLIEPPSASADEAHGQG